MRSFVAALAAFLLTFLPAVAFADPGVPTLLVTSNLTSGAHATTTQDAPPGSLIVVIVSVLTDAVTCTVTNSGSDTLSTAVNTYGIALRPSVGILYISNSAHDLPSGSQFTCTTSDSSDCRLSAYVITGANSGADGTGTAVGTSVGTLTASTSTLTSASEIAIGGFSLSSGASTFTEASGFTTLTGEIAGKSYGVAYQIVSATTALSYAPSWNPSTRASAAIATFKASPTANHTIGLMGIGVAANDNRPLQELRLAAR